MSAQVIFLNHLYHPSPDEWRRLEMIQEFLHFANIQFLYEMRGQKESEIRLKKEAVHDSARERIHVVPRRYDET